MGDCSYHGSRKDCYGNALYCEEESACNYNKLGDCSYAPVGYTCAGSEIKSNEEKEDDDFQTLLGILDKLITEGFQNMNRSFPQNININTQIEHFSTYDYKILYEEIKTLYTNLNNEYSTVMSDTPNDYMLYYSHFSRNF